MEAGQEVLLFAGHSISLSNTNSIREAINKMMATIQLNPYEREVVYGYPYVIGHVDGQPIRAPLFTIPITINTDGGSLSIVASADRVRFNSLPFRSDSDTRGVWQINIT